MIVNDSRFVRCARVCAYVCVCVHAYFLEYIELFVCERVCASECVCRCARACM